MKCKICGAEMQEDKLFKSSAVIMLFGNPSKDGLCRETRMLCPNGCGVEFVRKYE